MHSLKTQFEDYGENLYIRLSNEVSDRIPREITKFEADFSAKVRKDSNQLLIEGTRHTEKTVMILESQMEDLRIN